MPTPIEPATKRAARTSTAPSYVYHASFDSPAAAREYDPARLLGTVVNYDDRYMPDDVTRDHARCMHYAAHKLRTARTAAQAARWRGHYTTLRDHIVLGNRKLIYRAVRRRAANNPRADDMIGDCQIVLIQAVAAYNPWLGIRFSTYAYTCLVRALARMAQRLSTDWLARSMPLDVLPDGEPRGRGGPDPVGPGQVRIDEFLRDEHPLLSPREKAIISRRFCLREDTADTTLEQVGRALGLSKERVRQVQASALSKLRLALTPAHKA
jgi:DNA-directed RNA polymerase sigma subunit (sigma70/sigma32)